MLFDGFCGPAIAIAVTVVVAMLFLFALIFMRCDGDLLLMWKTKFGRNVESLSGHVVWITGASSGIGEALACRLSLVGCKLVLSARREKELARVKAACLHMGQTSLVETDILVLPLDMRDTESHIPAVQRVMRHFNKIDILINNAGITQRSAWTEVDPRLDRLIYEVNVLGPVTLTQAVLPHMLARRRGHVVVMSSIAGKMGLPRRRAYVGSKHALNGYFDSLRTELNQQTIDVTVLCPGPVVSNILVHAHTHSIGQVLPDDMAPSGPRMPTSRCAMLCSVAIANRLYEAWITQHPTLYLAYLAQYMPGLAKWLLLKYGEDGEN